MRARPRSGLKVGGSSEPLAHRPPWPLGGSRLAAPLAWLYGSGVALRNLAYDRGWARCVALPIPVVSIGNLTLGGSGKTPLVLETVELLRKVGRRPAVVSRGYGSRARGPLAIAPAAPVAARLAGDEPVMMQRRGVPVAVGRDRVAAARLAIERFHCDVLVLDDGFQHRRLERQVDLVVLDASLDPERLHLLPRGLLREDWPALGRADAVLLTRTDIAPDLAPWDRLLERYAPRAPRFSARHRITGLRSVQGGTPPPGSDLVLLSAIARPDLFEADVRRLGFGVDRHFVYRDHHTFTAVELEQAAQRARSGPGFLITTEKDWTRIPEAALADCRVLLLEIRELLDQPQAYLEFLRARIGS